MAAKVSANKREMTLELILKTQRAMLAAMKLSHKAGSTVEQQMSLGMQKAFGGKKAIESVAKLGAALKKDVAGTVQSMTPLVNQMVAKWGKLSDPQLVSLWDRLKDTMDGDLFSMEAMSGVLSSMVNDATDFNDVVSDAPQMFADLKAQILDQGKKLGLNEKQQKKLNAEYNRQLLIHKNVKKATAAIAEQMKIVEDKAKSTGTTTSKAFDTVIRLSGSLEDMGDVARQAENELRKLTQVSWKEALQSAENMEAFLNQIGNSFATQITVVAALAWDVIKDVYDKSVEVAVLWGENAADVSSGVLKISSSFRVANEQVMGVVNSMSQFVNLGDLSDKATRDMVGSLAQFGKVTGLSTEVVGEFGSRAMTQFKMSKEEVTALTKTMGSFAGKTTKDMQDIMQQSARR